MPTYKTDLAGRKFGKLRVKEFVEIRHAAAYWRCVCTACGRTDYEARASRLLDGTTTSCGCLGYNHDIERHRKARMQVPRRKRLAIARMGAAAANAT